MESFEAEKEAEDRYDDLRERYGIPDIADWGEFTRGIQAYYREQDETVKNRLADWLTEEGSKPVHAMDHFRSDLESGRMRDMAGLMPEAALKKEEHPKTKEETPRAA